VSMPTVRSMHMTSLRGAGMGSATTVELICSSLATNHSARSKDWV
jgi:hypothetical protein